MNTKLLVSLALGASWTCLGCSGQPKAEPASSAPVHVDPFADAVEPPPAHEPSQDVAANEQPQAEPAEPVAIDRPEILDIADLPQRTYVVDMTATEFMSSDDAFGDMAEQLRVHTEADISAYDIRDKAGLKQLHSTLMNIAIMQERYDDARVEIESIRSLETNPARKETTGLMMGAIVDSWQQSGRDNPASKELLARYLQQRIDEMPWAVIEVDIKSRLQSARQMNPVIFQTVIATGLDPMFQEKGQFNSTVARQLVTLKSILDIQMPVMDQVTLVYEDVIARNASQ
ncbi:MAG: hypothetical protein MK089_13380 [Phycisphaerales bacterium]|nr:hypothetical protein [Phycisphaerales bacterium]